MIIRTLTTAAAAAVLGFAAAPAFAQAQQGQAQAQAQMQIEPISNEELTDAQVEQFIDAAMGIQALVAEYRPQMEAAAGDQAELMALQQEAQGEIIVVVEETGLTPELYQSIGAAAQSDPEIAQRLQAEAQSRQEAAE
jgi:hypothetical protein